MTAAAVTGAYGLTLTGLEATPWLAVTGHPAWETVNVACEGELDSARPEIDPDGAAVRFAAGADLGEVVHPGLAWAALGFALARGRDSLHGGLLDAGDGRAWVVVGGKETGKSTLLAASAAAGLTVMADDVAVIDGDRALAGPRCVDLRHEPAEAAGAVTVVRNRWRVTLPPAPASAHLAGTILLEWGDEVELTRLRASEGLARLVARQQHDTWPRQPRTLMDLAGFPCMVLRRPRRMERMPDVVDALRGLADGGPAHD